MSIFNPHGNVTADGVLITEGLEVFTNELEVGKVVEDPHGSQGERCCLKAEHVGQLRNEIGTFTDHSKQECDAGGWCRHNHWFTIETAKGTKSFDGERLATVHRDYDGKRHVAKDEITW